MSRTGSAPSDTSTRPESPAHARSRFVEAAFELFSRRGFDGVTLDGIAAAVGVTKGSLCWHFESKKELVLETCAFYYRNWQRDAFAEMARARSPREQLRRVLRMSVERCLFDERNRVFTTELFAMAVHDREIRAGWAQFYDSVRELFVGLVVGANSGGEFNNPHPVESVNWMLAAIEGFKQRAVFEPEICNAAHRDHIVGHLMEMVSGNNSKPSKGNKGDKE